jgi:HD-like signal output (HDOD) protein
VALLSAAPFTTVITLNEVVRDLEHLPAAPRVLPKLKLLLSDGNTSMDSVVEMVRLDPGIAARVLQFGNSAYFSHGLRCYTVEEAVNRVGYSQIYELVATAVAVQVLDRPLRTYCMDADELWQNSIACALAAEELAEQLDLDRNIAYTVGLLHSIGMLAIDSWATRRRPDLRLELGLLPLEACEAERLELGFNQAEAGASLLRLWAFPQVMSEPIRWQYLPTGTAAHFKLSALLHCAKWIRTRVLHPNVPAADPSQIVLKRLSIGRIQLSRFCEIVASRLRGINESLDTKEAKSSSTPAATARKL